MKIDVTAKCCMRTYEVFQAMKITEEQERAFNTAEMCHICETSLGADRVRDHCHRSSVIVIIIEALLMIIVTSD